MENDDKAADVWSTLPAVFALAVMLLLSLDTFGFDAIRPWLFVMD